MERELLLKRATELGMQDAASRDDVFLETWIAETEQSQDFYRRLDDDVARDMAPGGRYYGG